ncbi:DUF397 domain-containing protein [Streptomyces somaliensis]|uniref:DUF397 domain-containing protein n=1 Tax=Streptomyces somaliensis TaxID=78355 RepID=UPI0020CF044C|nr:DUF397 domain-containing protein [Streptomyces somaliensis]MCP9944887.1 DUF397 domain-containing protein [Streptomyces somaliensis]MCP9961889.1 DUF397 domain-containing protein [Streptomyces somaliensis]MCP9974710.1 DUF397 domain-containing protein [Streptomyces somaliensis]
MTHVSRPDLSAAVWRKSSHSNAQGGECVEVADGFTGTVPVRDSKNPARPALIVSGAAWDTFVDSLK